MSVVTRGDVESDTAYPHLISQRTRFTIWRAAAWSGPIFLAALGLFWAVVAGFFPPPHESMTAVQVQHFFLHHGARRRIGLVGYLFFGGLYIPWSLAISRVIERIEGPRGILSQVEFAGGVATALVALLAGVMWLAAAFRTASRSPQDVQTLMDLGWFIFNLTFIVTALQMVAVGVAALLDRRATPLYPRWISWVSFLFAGTFIPLLLIPFVTRGPFAWQGLFNFYVALGGAFAWDLLVAYCTFGAIRAIEREDLAGAAVSTAG